MNDIYLDNTGYENATPKSWDMSDDNFFFLSDIETKLVNESAEDAGVTFEEAYEVLLKEGEVKANPLTDWE